MGRPSEARKQLIEAARNVIFAHSYEGVSIDELRAAAGVEKSVTPLAMAAFANMHVPLSPTISFPIF